MATITAGVAVRFVHFSQPTFVAKYAGSALWAATIYWVVSTVLGRVRLLRAVALAGCVATAVEFFKLYRSPGMDAFRGTVAGVLLLGRYFSWWDIAAYWVGIGLAVGVDWRVREGKARG